MPCSCTCPAHQLPAWEKQTEGEGKGAKRDLWKGQISGSSKRYFRIWFYSEYLSTKWRRVTPQQEQRKSCWCKNHILIWPPALRYVMHLCFYPHCSLAVKEVYFSSHFNDRKLRIWEVIIQPFKALFKYLGIERGQCARKRRSSENISANIKREPNAFCYAGPPGKDIFCKPGLNWCWALENSGPLSSILWHYGSAWCICCIRPSNLWVNLCPGCTCPIYFDLFLKRNFRRKINVFFFLFLLFFFFCPSHLSAWDLQ